MLDSLSLKGPWPVLDKAFLYVRWSPDPASASDELWYTPTFLPLGAYAHNGPYSKNAVFLLSTSTDQTPVHLSRPTSCERASFRDHPLPSTLGWSSLG